MGLKRVTAPTAKLLSVQELRDQVSLLSSDHDGFLSKLLARATDKAERVTKRAFLTQTWRLTLNRFPRWAIRLPRPPLQSVTTISYVDENGTSQTLDPSLYRVAADSEPGYVTPAYNEVWPAIRDVVEAVTITYIAGYGADATTVPEDARHAVALMVADMFAHRGDEEVKMAQAIGWLLDGLKMGAQPGWYELEN